MIPVYTQDQSLVSVLPLHVAANGRFSSLPPIMAFNAFAVSFQAAVVWPTNNLAVYSPVVLPAAFTLSRFFIVNGNTTGTIDLGLYDASGKLLSSTGGTVARVGANATQYVAVTARPCPAGTYYIGLVCSLTTGTVRGVDTTLAVYTQACGLLQEALAGPVLPATMTPVEYTGTVSFNYGFTQSAAL